MAEGVVVLLKAVEVEKEQRARGGQARQLELKLEVGQQTAAIFQACQRIRAGLGVGLGERALVLQEGERHAGQRQQQRPRGEAHPDGVHGMLEVVVHEQLHGHEPASHRHGHDQPVLNRDLLSRRLPRRHGHQQRRDGPREVEQRPLHVLVHGALDEVEAVRHRGERETAAEQKPDRVRAPAVQPKNRYHEAQKEQVAHRISEVHRDLGRASTRGIHDRLEDQRRDQRGDRERRDRSVEPEAAAERVGARAGQQQQRGVAGWIEGEVEDISHGRVGRVRVIGVHERPGDLTGGPRYEPDAHDEPRRALLRDHDRARDARRAGRHDQAAIDPILEEPVELRGTPAEGRMEYVCEQGKPS